MKVTTMKNNTNEILQLNFKFGCAYDPISGLFGFGFPATKTTLDMLLAKLREYKDATYRIKRERNCVWFSFDSFQTYAEMSNSELGKEIGKFNILNWIGPKQTAAFYKHPNQVRKFMKIAEGINNKRVRWA